MPSSYQNLVQFVPRPQLKKWQLVAQTGGSSAYKNFELRAK